MTSIPIKVLHDAINTVVSLEVENGEVYTGTLVEVQDSMNVILQDVKRTSKSGKTVESKSCLVRGSTIVLIQLPDALQTCPSLVAAQNIVSKVLDKRGEGNGFAHRRKRARRDE